MPNYKLKSKRAEIRYLSDMKKVLYDKKWLKTAKNFPIYYVYRGVRKLGELRYDITVIPPRMLGQEFPKTKGHSHSFKELYQVLSGEGLFLLQKCQNKKVKDVFCIKAKKGDILVVPSDYEHLIINSSKKNLKTGNWLSKKCRSLYGFIEKMRGACYFYTTKGWIKNKNYKKIRKIRFEKPFKKLPKNLDFLKE